MVYCILHLNVDEYLKMVSKQRDLEKNFVSILMTLIVTIISDFHLILFVQVTILWLELFSAPSKMS